MLASARLAPILRHPALRDTVVRTTFRRAFPRSAPLRQRPNLASYHTAKPSKTSSSRAWRSAYRSLFSLRFRNVRFNSSTPKTKGDPTPHLGSPEPLTIRARMRRMTKEYGGLAIGTYLALSALDFPFCFLAVRLAGPERIGHIEHAILSNLKSAFAPVWNMIEPVAEPLLEKFRKEKTEVQEKHPETASIWTELALAYGIHKTLLIFIRVPLTAALVPKIAKALRARGWKVGRQKA